MESSRVQRLKIFEWYNYSVLCMFSCRPRDPTYGSAADALTDTDVKCILENLITRTDKSGCVSTQEM